MTTARLNAKKTCMMASWSVMTRKEPRLTAPAFAIGAVAAARESMAAAVDDEEEDAAVVKLLADARAAEDEERRPRARAWGETMSRKSLGELKSSQAPCRAHRGSM